VPLDLNVLAFRTVKQATEQDADAAGAQSRKIATSRKGGLIGGAVRAQRLSGERRREIAMKANQARWRKPQNPNKD